MIKEFDPNLHEAVMQEKGEEDNLVLEEFEVGYKVKEKVLRPTKVKVSKKESILSKSS